MWRIGEVFARNPRRTSSFVRVLSCNLISEREFSWCFVAVSVDFLVPMEILSWQIPTFALNKGAHLPLVPTRPHHVEVRRGFRDPAHGLVFRSQYLVHSRLLLLSTFLYRSVPCEVELCTVVAVSDFIMNFEILDTFFL